MGKSKIANPSYGRTEKLGYPQKKRPLEYQPTPGKSIMYRSPRIEITYCTGCRWLLRAAWMAQEILTTFADKVGEVALVPGQGGVFEIRVGEKLIWSREEQGGFPEIKQLKQLVRDSIAPEMELGHSDRRTGDASQQTAREDRNH